MKKVQNKKVEVFAVLIGNRYYTCTDFEVFNDKFPARSYYPTLYIDYLGRENYHFKKILGFMEEKINILIKSDRKPLVIFPILSTIAAKEARALIECFKRLRINENIFIYPIVWDSYDNGYLHKSGNASYIYINLRVPSIGAERLVCYMNRIMGHDLPDGFFPEYSQEEASKMARHINHENFNCLIRKKNSIPKYPIVNGKPNLPILYVKEKCPNCGLEYEIFRGWLNKNGNVQIICRGKDCCKPIFFKGNENKFDPWPEFDEYRKEQS